MSNSKALVSIHTYCTAEFRKRVALAALQDDLAVSELVNRLLAEWLETRERRDVGQEEKD